MLKPKAQNRVKFCEAEASSSVYFLLDMDNHTPAKQIVAPTAPHLANLEGSFANPQQIQELAKKVNVSTMETEHVEVNTFLQT